MRRRIVDHLLVSLHPEVTESCSQCPRRLEMLSGLCSKYKFKDKVSTAQLLMFQPDASKRYCLLEDETGDGYYYAFISDLIPLED